MRAGLLFRRLIIPSILILCCAAATIATIGSIRSAALVWVSVIVAVVSALAIVLLARTYARRQARDLVYAIATALDQPDSRNANPNRIDDAIASAARSVEDALTQASTDKSQLMTIISSMSEGLIAIDHRQRILLSNRAAEQLLGLPPTASGMLLWEAVRSADVLELVSRVKLTGRRQMIDAGPIDGRYLEVTVARLSADRYPGLIIVAHDVTE